MMERDFKPSSEFIKGTITAGTYEGMPASDLAAGTITVNQPEPEPEPELAIVIRDVNAREMIRISRDGTVVLHPDLTLDEASMRFWEAVRCMAGAGF